MVNICIQKSRKGIAYQDRYALLKFLEYFRSGRLKEFYVDYSFNERGNSIDMLVILANPIEEQIFEIKTGERFKTNKAKGFSRELQMLHEFSQGRKNMVSMAFLIIDPEIHTEILQYWNDLVFIQEKKRAKLKEESYNEVIERCKNNWGFNKIEKKDFLDFVKHVKFQCDLSNKKVENIEQSPLERLITTEIKSICGKFRGAEEEMPYLVTMQELLEVIKNGAESGNNILNLAFEVLTISFARRFFIEKWIKKDPGHHRASNIEKQKNLIAKHLRNKYQKIMPDIEYRNSLIKEIKQIINSEKYFENQELILQYLQDKDLRYYFLDRLPNKFTNLTEIEFILEELVKDKKPFVLFRILENSVSVENNNYILGFISKHYDDFAESFKGGRIDRMFQESALRIIKKIVESNQSQIDNVLEFLTKLFKKRKYNVRKLFDNKDNVEQEKSLVGEILFGISEKKGIDKNLIGLIEKNFDLISDYGEFSDLTPKFIFNIFYEYIIKSENFEKTFKEIVKIILDQHLQLDLYKGKDGKNKFEGHEWIGGGISQIGNVFSTSDRHFVDYVLRPALNDYYQKNPKEAFEFIKSFCIQKDKKDKIVLSKKHPDFLLRASVGVLLKEYKDGNQEAENILYEFLTITKGIPNKVDLVFQELHKGDYNLSKEQKYRLVKKQLDIPIYEGLPANVFVLKVIIDLVKGNYPSAFDLFFTLVNNNKLYKGMWHAETIIVEMIRAMITSNSIKGLEGFKNYIQTDYFKNELGTFDAYPVSHLLNSILRNPALYKQGIEILQDLVKQRKSLTSNQQILICNSLIDARGSSDSEDIEVLMKIYNDFLWPLLNKRLKKDLRRDYKNENYGLIYNKFPFPYAREKFVQFAERLAKKKKIREALNIIEIFVNDPDPFTPLSVDPDDKRGEYDGHKKILQGEEVGVINTVRGWCGWALLQCSVVESRSYIKEMIELAKKLIEDKNLYVASYGANALSGLAGNRLTVTPEDKNVLFFGKDTKEALENAKEVERLAFEFLKRIEKEGHKIQDALDDNLVHLFNPMRALNQAKAENLIGSLSKMSPKVIAKAAPLFIFFAEFRKEFFKDWKWHIEGLYDDLKDFNAEPLQKILENVLKRNNSGINSSFAWQLWKLIRESADDKAEIEGVLTYSRAFSIACKYLNIVADYFDGLAFSHIFRFVEENIMKKPKECYELTVKALNVEKEMLEDKIKDGNFSPIDWWPHYKMSEVLSQVKDHVGIEECLKIIDILLSYPKIVRARAVSDVLVVLQSIPVEYNKDRKIEKVFDKLIEIDPHYYDIKEEWKKKIK